MCSACVWLKIRPCDRLMWTFSGPAKGWQFLDKQSDCKLLKEDSISTNHSTSWARGHYPLVAFNLGQIKNIPTWKMFEAGISCCKVKWTVRFWGYMVLRHHKYDTFLQILKGYYFINRILHNGQNGLQKLPTLNTYG